MQRSKLIAKLNKHFPDCNAVPSEGFDGVTGGIWFRGAESELAPDGAPLFNYWAENPDRIPGGVHPDLEAMLDAGGYFSEPYDAGTLFAWRW